MELFGGRQVGLRGVVGFALDRQSVPVQVPPGLEEGQEPEPQSLAGLVPDRVRCEKVDVAEQDHAVPAR